MTTIMDWIRSLGTSKKRSEEQVEERVIAPDLKSLEEQVANMSMSGCGCYRHPARNLFAKYSGGTAEETVRVYQILREKLHSSCGGSSYTSSNIGTVREALNAAYAALENGAPETRRGVLKSLGVIVYDLECDGERYGDIFTNRDVQRLSTLASKLMGEEEYATAVEALAKARRMAGKTQNATVAVGMIEGLLTTYRPRAIAALSKGGRSKVQDLRTVIYCTTEGELQQKLLERMNRIENVRAEYVDRFIDQVVIHYWGKIRPIKKKVADVEHQYADQKSTIERGFAPERRGHDRSISYLQQSREQTTEDALRSDLDRMIGVKLAEKSTYETTMQERVAAVDLEKTAAIQPLQEQIEALKQSLNVATEHYRAGTMTRAEYKAMDHEMRETRRNDAQKR